MTVASGGLYMVALYVIIRNRSRYVAVMGCTVFLMLLLNTCNSAKAVEITNNTNLTDSELVRLSCMTYSLRNSNETPEYIINFLLTHDEEFSTLVKLKYSRILIRCEAYSENIYVSLFVTDSVDSTLIYLVQYGINRDQLNSVVSCDSSAISTKLAMVINAKEIARTNNYVDGVPLKVNFYNAMYIRIDQVMSIDRSEYAKRGLDYYTLHFIDDIDPIAELTAEGYNENVIVLNNETFPCDLPWGEIRSIIYGNPGVRCNNNDLPLSNIQGMLPMIDADSIPMPFDYERYRQRVVLRPREHDVIEIFQTNKNTIIIMQTVFLPEKVKIIIDDYNEWDRLGKASISYGYCILRQNNVWNAYAVYSHYNEILQIIDKVGITILP